METLETHGNAVETPEGNTKISRVVPSRYWCFTLNNWTKEEVETLETTFNKLEIKYTFTEEIAPTTGTPHLQGFIQSKNKIRPSEKIKIKRIHWEKCKGNEDQNINYVTKSSGKVYSNIRIIPDLYTQFEPYEWQKEIVKYIKTEPDNRIIRWYWSKIGCNGKTTLARHLCLKYGAIYVSGKSTDVKNALVNMKEKPPKIVIFGVPRASEDYMSYGALEEVKDAIFFSGKYESEMYVGHFVHVIVFANFAPDLSKLSKDRWLVQCLDNEEDENIDLDEIN